jgi:hypothetical protein
MPITLPLSEEPKFKLYSKSRMFPAVVSVVVQSVPLHDNAVPVVAYIQHGCIRLLVIAVKLMLLPFVSEPSSPGGK